jgi:hypothetical protein
MAVNHSSFARKFINKNKPVQTVFPNCMLGKICDNDCHPTVALATLCDQLEIIQSEVFDFC